MSTPGNSSRLALVDNAVVDDRLSDTERAPRKAPKNPNSKKRKSHSKNRLEKDESDEIQTDKQSLLNKPPTPSASRTSIRDNLQSETEATIKRDEVVTTKKPRKIRSRSASRERPSESGRVNEAYESDTSYRKSARSRSARRSESQGVRSDNEVKDKEKKVKTKKKEKSKDGKKAEKIIDTDPQILSVVVHQCDKLRTDVNIYHPMVRIHLIDLDSDGRYVKKSNKSRHVICYYEKENTNVDYIQPIMTTPFDFKIHRSLVPKWEEIIVFNESFKYLTNEHPRTLILFEIMDTMKSEKVNEVYSKSGKNSGWQRIAWAFLKIVGADNTLNTEKKIRLQLYYSQTYYSSVSDDQIPEVYSLYKSRNLIKYPSTLHVTVKSIFPPKTFAPCLRSFYAFQQEKTNNENENPLIHNPNELLDDGGGLTKPTNLVDDDPLYSVINKAETQLLKQKFEPKPIIWSRLAGQPCRIPNSLVAKLPSGKNGCYSLKFSKTGSYIACALVEENFLSPVVVYEIPDGKLYTKLQGHFGLIYDLDWSANDTHLVTASNDATARVFSIFDNTKETKILPHPTFVYAAKFHPSSDQIICTGAYDKVIRVWSIFKQQAQYGLLMQELYGHIGYINSICFSNDGSSLYSADSFGKIYGWNSSLKQDEVAKGIVKDWTPESVIELDELKDSCINHIELHPNQRQMMIHTRDNQLRLIDIRIQAILHSYGGSVIFNEFMRSSMTPCGTFVFSSAIDTRVLCWNVDSGDLVTTNNIDLNYLKPPRDIHYHPFDHIIAFASYGPHSPIYIFKYDSDKATKDVQFNEKALYMSQSGRLANLVTPRQMEIADNDNHEGISKDTETDSDLDKYSKDQLTRWKRIQDQLDAVYTSAATINQTTKSGTGKRKEAKHEEIPLSTRRSEVNGSILLTMNATDKPEFKYYGPKETQDRVIVLYDYKAQRSDELDLKKGDEIFVHVRDSPQWWMGELMRTRKQGYFPSSYVQVQETPKIHNEPKFNFKDAITKYNRVFSDSTQMNIINEVPTRDRPGSSRIPKERQKDGRIHQKIDGAHNATSEI